MAQRLSRSLPIALIAAPLVLGMASRAARAQDPERPSEPPFHFAEGHATPPIPIHLASNKVHVPVSMGGETVWFLLDSGANVSVLNREYTEQLGLELRNESTGTNAAGGRSFWYAFTNGPAYGFPTLEVRGHPFAVLERRTQSSNGHDSAGLLGANHFQRFVVDIDYPGRTLRLHDPEHFAYDGPGVVVPLELNQNSKALIDVVLKPYGAEPLAARVSVDTGGRGLLTLNAPFVEEQELLSKLPKSVLTTVGFGIGGVVRHHVGRFEELRIGSLVVSDVPATLAPKGTTGAYGQPDKSGVLDAELLTRFRMIFDYSRERLIFEPREDLAKAFEFDMSGAFLTAQGPDYNQPEVMSLLEASPAAKAGLEVGDVILSIDGVSCVNYSLDEVRALLKTDGVTRRLTIRRGDQELSIELQLQRLI